MGSDEAARWKAWKERKRERQTKRVGEKRDGRALLIGLENSWIGTGV